MNWHLDGILGFSGAKRKYVCKETELFVMYVCVCNDVCKETGLFVMYVAVCNDVCKEIGLFVMYVAVCNDVCN
jgi:hypothetical protein